MELRSRILQAAECTFKVEITADYGEKIHTFTMECSADTKGNVEFSVSEPETISGITGTISAEGGALTFEDTALHFELMAEEQLSPVSAPWILVKTLRSGYLSSACVEDGSVRLSMDDRYAENPLMLDIWLSEEGLPEKADILYDGRRILSVAVENFEIL